MNLNGLKALIGGRVLLRPKAKAKNGRGALEDRDDEWQLESVERTDGIRLRNGRTGHLAYLGLDHVHHFVSRRNEPDGIKRGIWELTVELELRGNEVVVEPILTGPAGRLNLVERAEESRTRFLGLVMRLKVEVESSRRLMSLWRHYSLKILDSGTDLAVRLNSEEREALEQGLTLFRQLGCGQLFELNTLHVLDRQTIEAAQHELQISRSRFLEVVRILSNLAGGSVY